MCSTLHAMGMGWVIAIEHIIFCKEVIKINMLLLILLGRLPCPHGMLIVGWWCSIT